MTLRARLLSLALSLFGILGSLPLSAASAAEGPAYRREVKVTPLFRTQTDYAGRRIEYPVHGDAEVTAVLVEVPPGRQTGWHQHPVPCFAYLLEGEMELELATGGRKTFRAGDALAEVVDLLHNGVNRGSVPARLVMFVIGVAGQPYAVRPPESAPAAP